MAHRIDGVKLILDVYNEFEGRRTIEFDVPLPDDPFLSVVEAKWREYFERLTIAAHNDPNRNFTL